MIELTPKRIVLVVLAVALVLVLALSLRRCGPGPRQVIRDTTAAAVEQGKPVAAPLSLPQRITTVTIKPTGSARAPGAAAGELASLCRSAGWAPAGMGPRPEIPAAVPAPAVLTGESAASPPPPPASQPPAPLASPARSLAWIQAATGEPRRLVVWTGHTDGSERVDTFAVRHRRFGLTRQGDELLLRGPRFPYLVDAVPVLECGIGAGATGALAARGTDLKLAAIPAALLCIHGTWRAMR